MNEPVAPHPTVTSPTPAPLPSAAPDPSAAPAPDTAPAPEATAPSRPPRWPFATLLVAAVFGLGIWAGAAIGHRGERQPAPVLIDSVDAAGTTLPVDAAVMPDVLGLDEAAVRTSIADAGLDNATVQTRRRPYVGRPGRVIAQEPTRRSSNPSAISLVLAEPVAVPELVGTAEGDAAARLEALGAQINRVRGYAPGVDAGTVVAVLPAAGQPLTDTVTVLVASAPAQLFLADLAAVDASCPHGSVSAAGTVYPRSVVCSASRSTPTTGAWVFAKAARRLTATVRQTDESRPGAMVHVVVSGDGRTLAELDVPYGAAVPLDVDTTDVLRLEVAVVVVGQPPQCCPRVALGDAVLLGAPDAIADLAARKP